MNLLNKKRGPIKNDQNRIYRNIFYCSSLLCGSFSQRELIFPVFYRIRRTPDAKGAGVFFCLPPLFAKKAAPARKGRKKAGI